MLYSFSKEFSCNNEIFPSACLDAVLKQVLLCTTVTETGLCCFKYSVMKILISSNVSKVLYIPECWTFQKVLSSIDLGLWLVKLI